MDPFRNRTKVDERRVTSDEKTTRREGKTNNGLSILDFVVVGSLCTICGQPVCVDEVLECFISRIRLFLICLTIMRVRLS